MGITKYSVFTVLGFTWLQVSCAAPKATVVDQAPVKAKQENTPPQTAAVPSPTVHVDDGLRMPDMLAMPSEGDFQSTRPGASKISSPSGAVISRPPADGSPLEKPQAE